MASTHSRNFRNIGFGNFTPLYQRSLHSVSYFLFSFGTNIFHSSGRDDAHFEKISLAASYLRTTEISAPAPARLPLHAAYAPETSQHAEKVKILFSSPPI